MLSVTQGCIQGHISKVKVGSGRGQAVKPFACGARGPKFDSRPHHLNFRDWTLGQGRDTPFDHRKPLFEILSRSNMAVLVRSYVRDTDFWYVSL